MRYKCSWTIVSISTILIVNTSDKWSYKNKLHAKKFKLTNGLKKNDDNAIKERMKRLHVNLRIYGHSRWFATSMR